MNGKNLATTAALLSGILFMSNSTSSVPIQLSASKPEKQMSNLISNKTGVNSTRLGIGNRFSLDLLHLNLQRLESFKKLGGNWNGYEGDPIDIKLIDLAKEFITQLAFQPQVFPTGRGTIQVEKYFDENNFFEIELSQEFISIYKKRNSHESESEVAINELSKIVDELNA